MAEIISRLKLESGEYDAKIKRAVTGLQQMETECRKVGGTLAILEKDQKQYVQALGQMQTVSQTTRGKLAELTAAYTELRIQYKRLTDEEKQGDYGKALSSSLEQLKARIGETKGQLQEVGKEISGSDSLLDKLASKFTINIDAMKLFNIGLQAAEGALNVAKDAFFASEATVDEWGRIVDSSRSLYEGFLTSINTGDISGFLTRIDSIVSAARKAYDELDRLGTMKTIQAPKVSAQQTENERMRMMIQTGRNIKPRDGRRATMAEGQILTPAQIKILERQLQNGIKTAVGLIGNEVDQTGKAINAYYDKLAKTNGMSLQEFKKGTSSWAEFSKKMQGYDDYVKWDKQARTEFAKQGGRGNVDFDKSNPHAEFRKWGTLRVDKEGDNSYKDLVNLIQQRDQQMSQAYGMQAQAYRTINRAEGITTRKIMGGGGGGRSGGHGGGGNNVYIPVEGSIDWQTAKVQELQKAYRAAADDDSRKKIKAELDAASKVLSEMTAKTKVVSTESLTELQLLQDALKTVQNSMSGYGKATDEWKTMNEEAERLQKQIDKLNGTPLKLVETSSTGQLAVLYDQLQTIQNSKQNAATYEDYQAMSEEERSIQKQINEIENPKEVKLSETLSDISSGMGNMVSGIESLGIKVPNSMKKVISVMQGISSILTGISSIVSAIQVITTAQIFKLSNGGVVRAAIGVSVPGNSFSGDRVPALLNSGETVLNRAQVGNLSSQLNSPRGIMAAQPFVEGDKIFLGINNSLSHSGQGEIVTTSMLRQFGLI